VIVRTDLTSSQQAVQAAHAAIEVARSSIPDSLEHPHLVICGVKSESQLARSLDTIRDSGIQCLEWREADLNDSLTAIGTFPVFGDDRRIFKRFNLIKLPESKNE
jgi:hypothetical protein